MFYSFIFIFSKFENVGLNFNSNFQESKPNYIIPFGSELSISIRIEPYAPLLRLPMHTTIIKSRKNIFELLTCKKIKYSVSHMAARNQSKERNNDVQQRRDVESSYIMLQDDSKPRITCNTSIQMLIIDWRKTQKSWSNNCLHNHTQHKSWTDGTSMFPVIYCCQM